METQGAELSLHRGEGVTISLAGLLVVVVACSACALWVLVLVDIYRHG